MVSRFDLETTGAGGAVVERFHLLPTLVLAIPVACALDACAHWLVRRAPAIAVRAGTPRIALAAALFVGLAALALPRAQRDHSPADADAMTNMLRSLPDGAIVVVEYDDYVFGLGYVQFATHARPDVTVVVWPHVQYAWYVADLAAAGLAIDPSRTAPLGPRSAARVTAQLLATGRPVFADDAAHDILAAYPHYPFGLLVRVLPHAATPPSLDDVRTINQHLYLDVYRFDYALPGRDDVGDRRPLSVCGRVVRDRRSVRRRGSPRRRRARVRPRESDRPATLKPACKLVSNVLVARGGALTLAVLALYLAIAPPHLVDGDNAHFAALGAVGGAAHPSGYPLYVLWLRAWSWLPGATPAHTAALATAILGALQVAALHAACRAWGARPLAATIAVGIYAVGPVAMRMHTEAEVFALNGLVVAAVLWLAARGGPLRGGWRTAVLGLVAGLGMANHFTCVLVAPIGLLGVVRGVREAVAPARAIAGCIGGFVVGILPYAYLFVARTGLPAWGHLTSFADARALVLREDYGGPFAFSPIGDPVPVVDSVLGFVRTVGRAWWWAPAAFGVGMLAWRSARPSGAGDEPVWGWRWLAVSWLVAGPLLALRFNLPPVGVGRYVVERFHLLPAMLLAIPVAVALDALGTRLAARARESVQRSARVHTPLALLLVGAAAATSLAEVQRLHAPVLEREIDNLIATLPADAVVIGTTDDLLFGFAYAQVVRHDRSDVTYVSWSAMPNDWYRDDLARDGFTVDVNVAGDRLVAVAQQVLARHRRLFVMPDEHRLDAFPHYAFGILVEILPPGTPAPDLDAVIAINKGLYKAFDVDYTRPHVGDEWPALIQLRYAMTWAALGKQLEAAGRADDAHWAYGVANALAPAPD